MPAHTVTVYIDNHTPHLLSMKGIYTTSPYRGPKLSVPPYEDNCEIATVRSKRDDGSYPTVALHYQLEQLGVQIYTCTDGTHVQLHVAQREDQPIQMLDKWTNEFDSADRRIVWSFPMGEMLYTIDVNIDTWDGSRSMSICMRTHRRKIRE